MKSKVKVRLRVEGKYIFILAENAKKIIIFNRFCWCIVAMVIDLSNVKPFISIQGEEDFGHALSREKFGSELYGFVMRRVQSLHPKRPHVLPPLPNLQKHLRPMDPLQPPDLLFMESRLGSPAPKPIPLESDYDFNTNDGKPLIKISESEENVRKESNGRELLKLDLLSDPLFGDHNDLLAKVQKRNAFRILEAEQKRHERETMIFNNLCKNQLKNLRDDLDKKIRCSIVQPLDDEDKGKSSELKVVQIPSRYAPLKPIGQTENKD